MFRHNLIEIECEWEKVEISLHVTVYMFCSDIISSSKYWCKVFSDWSNLYHHLIFGRWWNVICEFISIKYIWNLRCRNYATFRKWNLNFIKLKWASTTIVSTVLLWREQWSLVCVARTLEDVACVIHWIVHSTKLIETWKLAIK